MPIFGCCDSGTEERLKRRAKKQAVAIKSVEKVSQLEKSKILLLEGFYQNFVESYSTRTFGFGEGVSTESTKNTQTAFEILYGTEDLGFDRNKLIPYCHSVAVSFQTGQGFKVVNPEKNMKHMAKPPEDGAAIFRVERLEMIRNRLNDAVAHLNASLEKGYNNLSEQKKIQYINLRARFKELLEEFRSYVRKDADPKKTDAGRFLKLCDDIWTKNFLNNQTLSQETCAQFNAQSQGLAEKLKACFRKAAKVADMSHSNLINECFIKKGIIVEGEMESWASTWYRVWNAGCALKLNSSIEQNVLGECEKLHPPKCPMGGHLKDRYTYYKIRLAVQREINEKLCKQGQPPYMSKKEEECLEELIQYCKDKMAELKLYQVSPSSADIQKQVKKLRKHEGKIADWLKKADTELAKFGHGPFTVEENQKNAHSLATLIKQNSANCTEPPMKGDRKQYVAVRALVEEKNGDRSLYFPDGRVHIWKTDGTFECVEANGFRCVIRPEMPGGKPGFRKGVYPPESNMPSAVITRQWSELGAGGVTTLDRSDKFVNVKLHWNQQNKKFEWKDFQLKSLPEGFRPDVCDRKKGRTPEARYVAYRTYTENEDDTWTLKYANGEERTAKPHVGATPGLYVSDDDGNAVLEKKDGKGSMWSANYIWPEEVKERDISKELKKQMEADQQKALEAQKKPLAQAPSPEQLKKNNVGTGPNTKVVTPPVKVEQPKKNNVGTGPNTKVVTPPVKVEQPKKNNVGTGLNINALIPPVKVPKQPKQLSDIVALRMFVAYPDGTCKMFLPNGTCITYLSNGTRIRQDPNGYICTYRSTLKFKQDPQTGFSYLCVETERTSNNPSEKPTVTTTSFEQNDGFVVTKLELSSMKWCSYPVRFLKIDNTNSRPEDIAPDKTTRPEFVTCRTYVVTQESGKWYMRNQNTGNAFQMQGQLDKFGNMIFDPQKVSKVAWTDVHDNTLQGDIRLRLGMPAWIAGGLVKNGM